MIKNPDKTYSPAMSDDPVFQELGTFMQSQWDYFKGKILGLRHLYWADRTNFSRELALMLGAYLSQFDTDTTLRIKAENAIYTHQNLPHWTNVWKPIIDEIYGGDSQIWKGQYFFGAFIVGESIIGGYDRIGSVAESFVTWSPGVVLIDVDNPAPTSDQQNMTIQALREMIPEYWQVYCGFQSTISVYTVLQIFLDVTKEVKNVNTL